VETVAEGLKNPWGMVQLPDGRFLITERPGQLRILDNGKLLETPVAGVPPVFISGQAGLMDIQLHPDYAQNGWIYLAFAKPSADKKKAMTNIIRAHLKDNTLVDQETIYDPPAEDYVGGGIHFGCRMQFDAEHHLFFTIGDRHDYKDPVLPVPENVAQRVDNVKGKVHRLMDDGKVPADNPFVNTPGARPSIWSYGHRNPQGLKFQPGTGILWETEHGPKGGDELNIIKKGLNYGWPIVTYGINYSGIPITDKRHEDGMEDSVKQWTPSPALCGIDFYMGDKFSKWKGNLFVTALAHQKMFRLELKDNQVVHEEILLEKTGRIRDVRCFNDGYVYVLYDSNPAKIIRLVPAE
jgi:glucose/arabinose dehydrogenase